MKPYALITGSSSGIGQDMALILASKGYNILLHGRNENALKALQAKINNEEVKCEYVIQDLCESNSVEEIITKIKDYPIEVFISNAGIGIPGNFVDNNLDDELKMTNLHVISIIKLTKYFIQNFSKMNKGYILNVSSLYAFFPVPKQSLYAATKTFQHSFFLSLHKEVQMAQKKIHISSLCPGLTYSQFRTRQGKDEQQSIVGLSSYQVAQIAIEGLFKNKKVIIPGFFNKLMALVIPILPYSIGLSIIYKINKQRGF